MVLSITIVFSSHFHERAFTSANSMRPGLPFRSPIIATRSAPLNLASSARVSMFFFPRTVYSACGTSNARVLANLRVLTHGFRPVVTSNILRLHGLDFFYYRRALLEEDPVTAMRAFYCFDASDFFLAVKTQPNHLQKPLFLRILF